AGICRREDLGIFHLLIKRARSHSDNKARKAKAAIGGDRRGRVLPRYALVFGGLADRDYVRRGRLEKQSGRRGDRGERDPVRSSEPPGVLARRICAQVRLRRAEL